MGCHVVFGVSIDHIEGSWLPVGLHTQKRLYNMAGVMDNNMTSGCNIDQRYLPSWIATYINTDQAPRFDLCLYHDPDITMAPPM